ncbi:NAD-dependent epimerase/dehydratase family protein [Roseibacillus ishigakijimensis]|uniref:NAD-dependent epimerase/dehydratase family protein n=1 Tax=Roseibacillus ishigakijimensis TaxID=454146 RepID=UPI001F3A690A|nr:NAD-dependent epimerase/dehydratase family protein [Roseibacillus ishigakijimensis]
MKILVTGSAGFIGRHVVRELEVGGHDVIGLDRRDKDSPLDLATVNLSQFPCEVIIHLAATSEVRTCEKYPAENWNQNVLLTQKVARYAEKTGLRLVFASSASVYGDHDGPAREDSPTRPIGNYGLAKLLSEQLVRARVADHSILRYFNVHGPGQTRGLHALLKKARERFTIHGDGRQTRDFVAVREVARITALAATEGLAGTYNLCSGEATTILDVVRGHPELCLDFAPPPEEDIQHSLGSREKLDTALAHLACQKIRIASSL